MNIEHFGYQVGDPAAAADWYAAHFGFTVRRSADRPVPVRFLADGAGRVMIEIYNNPKVQTPDYAQMDPLILHMAFQCDRVVETADRLVAAGATLVSGPETVKGDELAMLRDPWGLAIQLCKRQTPML